MKFTLFFLTLTLYTLWSFIESSDEPQSYLLLWLVINFLIMTFAYAFNKPSWIMGKNRKGEIKISLLILNFPWLLFSWSIFRLQMFVSRENRVDEVVAKRIALWLFLMMSSIE